MTTQPSTTRNRKHRQVDRRVQLRLIAAFAGVTLISLLFQFTYLVSLLSETASRMPEDTGHSLMTQVPQLLTEALLISLGVLLPVTIVVGIVSTTCIAGPIHEIKQFLARVRDGRRPTDLVLRESDELQDFCVIVNSVTAPLRQPGKEEHGQAA